MLLYRYNLKLGNCKKVWEAIWTAVYNSLGCNVTNFIIVNKFAVTCLEIKEKLCDAWYQYVNVRVIGNFPFLLTIGSY